MAGIDTGAGVGRRRSVNHDIPLIPFIDFLLCLVSFLLITAVWSQMARINADANVPNNSETRDPEHVKTLHVEMKSKHTFRLIWKEGSQVLEAMDVPRKEVRGGDETVAYPELAERISAEWSRNDARHYSATDPTFDRAVLHTDNSVAFAQVVAVIDAIHAPKRERRNAAGEVERVSALNVAFAVN